MRVVVVGLALAVVVAVGVGCDSCKPVVPPRGPPDAGPPDPNTVGLDARPTNTTCVAPARPVLQSAVTTTQPWPNVNLTFPVFMLQEPGSSSSSNKMYVLERGGRIVGFDKDGDGSDQEVWGDISARVNTTDDPSDERGLLGMAFHPDWPTVQQVFLSYSGAPITGDCTDVVSRFGVGADGKLDVASEDKLIVSDDPAFNHNGGMIAFSPTDSCRTCLYSGDGDGGAGDDAFGNGQNRQSLFAKIIRIDVDARTGAKHYGIPADNPFVGDSTFLPEIYAWGLRNPWRFSFDRGSGDLWVGDVGQNRDEEVDLVQAGGNYGWSEVEGDICHPIDANCDKGGFEKPIVTYAHVGGRVCVIGGYVYRGSAIPSLEGTYLYAEFNTGEVFALVFDAQGNPTPQVIDDETTRIASFAEDRDGELYILDHETGTIKKLVPAGPQQPDTFPQTLSATGCVDPADATKPAAGLIPYTVNHSLYSDGASKERFVALPDGKNATLLDDGDIDFPVGTVFVKTFTVAEQRVETRLLVHHDDGDWGGYSYEWNDAGSDATLVSTGGKTKTLANGQQWTYPSRNGCLSCHTLAAKRQLGWEVAQLNGGFVYPNGKFANQLHTLDVIGVFDGPLPGALDTLPALVPPDDTHHDAETVARAYLHVNCAICHRPGGIGVADTDWRFDTDFASMHVCNTAPTEGDLGVAGAKRLVPGDPARSLLSLRMKKLGAVRMPLLGSNVVDPLGTQVIDAWISSLTACP